MWRRYRTPMFSEAGFLISNLPCNISHLDTSQVLDSLPELGPYEIRINHRQLQQALLSSLGLPKEVAAPALQLLGTASSTSSLARYLAQQQASSSGEGADAGGGRAARWPAIKAGLDGLGVGQESVQRCKQCVLNLPGEGTHFQPVFLPLMGKR